MNANVKAELIFHEKNVLPDGSIIEMVIWRVPRPVAGSTHSFKYRLFFGRDGERIVGFDNQRGKGDHCHLDCNERPYVFSSVEKLVDDFKAEVRKRLK